MTQPLPTYVRGEGPDILLLPGFGMAPWTYEDTTKVVGRHARMLVPNWLAQPGRFSYEDAVDALVATLDAHDVDETIAIGHSYSGALALSLTARHPERVTCLVLVEATGLSARWELAYHARPGPYLWRLATYRSAIGFFRGGLRHPLRLAEAGLHAFLADLRDETEQVRQFDLPRHVLWAERDTLLPRSFGKQFAERLDATFTVITDPDGSGPVDHDWLWRHPHLLENQLQRLDAIPEDVRRA